MVREIKNSITEEYGKRNWIDQNNVVFGYSDNRYCCESWGWGVYDPETKKKVADSPAGLPYHFDFSGGAEVKTFHYSEDTKPDDLLFGREEEFYGQLDVVRVGLLPDRQGKKLIFEAYTQHDGWYLHNFSFEQEKPALAAKPKQAHKKYLCNADCNNCEAIENKQLGVLLNVLALNFGEEVWHIANRVCANMTCCPICRIDDFCHYCEDAKSGIAAIDEIGDDNASCEVAEMAKEIFKEFNTKRASR